MIRRHATGRARAGFTLMEMLVTLVLVSMTTMLMFQMLGSYRVARERVQAQSGLIDRQSLFNGWLRASVQGLFIDHGITFAGNDVAFEGTTLNALYALEATPTLVRWELETGEEEA
jgi:prepilin-type N-terminal cleavage/methylation domain-containing protein